MCIYKLNPTNVYNKGWNDQYLGLEKNPEEQHIKKTPFFENVFGIGQQKSCYLEREPKAC